MTEYKRGGEHHNRRSEQARLSGLYFAKSLGIMRRIVQTSSDSSEPFTVKSQAKVRGSRESQWKIYAPPVPDRNGILAIVTFNEGNSSRRVETNFELYLEGDGIVEGYKSFPVNDDVRPEDLAKDFGFDQPIDGEPLPDSLRTRRALLLRLENLL